MADLKKSCPAASLMLDFYDQLLTFDKKLQSYTLAKCAYERNMETCILEHLYYSNRSRHIMSQVRQC